MIFISKNLAAPILVKKGQIFCPTSPLFEPDALHRLQKVGSLDIKTACFFASKPLAKFLQLLEKNGLQNEPTVAHATRFNYFGAATKKDNTIQTKAAPSTRAAVKIMFARMSPAASG